MKPSIVLASGSQIRRALFENSGVEVEAIPARIDELSIRESLLNEEAKPRDIADALAEYKARKIASKQPTKIVIGSDQVLDFKGTLFSKPESRQNAIEQLKILRGATHSLYSAAVIYEDGAPVWRFVGRAQITMRNFSDDYLGQYVDRNWDEIRHCVGCYQLEAEGSRLFQQVSGDYFTVLGIPLIEVLAFLSSKGLIDG
jgi:septum formation protein